jgi:glycosyltransferase involved in cell wall biosynthesis
MKSILDLEADERRQMGLRSRALAERWFGLDRFVAEYEALYRGLFHGVE